MILIGQYDSPFGRRVRTLGLAGSEAPTIGVNRA
jgi:hypothetical protein